MLDAILRRLENREQLDEVLTAQSVRCQVDQLLSITVWRGSASIQLNFRAGDNEKSESLSVGSEREARHIAADVASALDVTFDRSEQQKTLLQMTRAPVILATFLAVIVSILYYAAATS